MAPLVFLARPAPAGIVAADLSGRASTGCPGADRRPRLWRRTPVAAGARAVGITRAALHDLAHKWRRRWRRCVALHLHPEDPGHDRRLDSFPELVEHLEGFVLVLDQGVTLSVRAQADALPEMLHLRQVLHPLPIDGAKHHVALHQRHEVGTDLLALLVVSVRGRLEQVLDRGLAAL